MTAEHGPELRAATLDDVDGIVDVWYAGWRQAHEGHVPDALLQHRHPDQFRARVPVRLPTTTVALVGGDLAGMVVTHDDELEQLYVADAHRGSGVAAALLDHGEARIAETHAVAFLAVVAGNGWARRRYERSGWHDAGAFDYHAWVPSGPPVPVPCRRYEKAVGVAPAVVPT